MESVSLPFIPVSLWLLTGAMTILILLVTWALYLYLHRWVPELIGNGSSFASLSAKKLRLENEVESLEEWIKRHKDELDSVKAEREQQESKRAILADLEQQCFLKSQENQQLRKEVGDLQNQQDILSQANEKLIQSVEKLKKENNELEAKRSEIEAIVSQLKSLSDELSENRRHKAELGIDIDIYLRKLHDLKNDVETLEQTAANIKALIQKDRDTYQKIVDDLEKIKIELEQKAQQLETARKQEEEYRELQNKVEKINHQIKELEDFFMNAQQEIKRYSDQVSIAKAESQKFETELNEFRNSRQQIENELAGLRKDKQLLENELADMRAQRSSIHIKVEDLKQEISRLEEEKNKKLSPPETSGESIISYTDIFNSEPLCLKKDAYKDKSDKDETSLLMQVKNTLRDDGLIFSSRIIDAFHTSIKCHSINPITVLAGVSGTGKTLLPVRYAEIMGMHKLVMAVQPGWDSPQDMFGFYNYLEKKYKATELSRALVRMDAYNEEKFTMLNSRWAKDRLLLVLLDEMNLARTEYYFSEFLSRLELRRAVKDPRIDRNRSEAEIKLDIGPEHESLRLWVGHNIFFVGTMNEDESTQTLSDKVLDRANVLRFGKPDENAKVLNNSSINRKEAAVNDKYLSFEKWREWQREFNEGAEWYKDVSGWTKQLNTALDSVGRPFGFRVILSIGHYVANYPRVEDENRYKLAFADQVEQKIIPKIRGIDMSSKSSKQCFSEISKVIDELGDDELISAFAAAFKESEETGMFQWRGITRREKEDILDNAY